MPSGFRRQLELRHKRTAAIRAAVADVRDQPHGQDRQRVRQALEARLDGLGVNPPVSSAVLDGIVDSIIADEGAGDRGRRVLRGMADDVGKALRVFNAIRDPASQHGLSMVLDKEPVMVRFDRSLPLLQVRLNPGIQEWLSEVAEPEISPGPKGIFVLLDGGEPESSGPVSVVAGTRHIGTLDTSGSELFRGILASGREQDRPVAAQATQELDSSGLWQVRVYRPSEG